MKVVLWIVTVLFAGLTAVAVAQHGATGILAYQLAKTDWRINHAVCG